MSREIRYPKALEGFEQVLGMVERVVDTSRRLPESPFLLGAVTFDFCEYADAIEGSFEPVLQALADAHGDTTVSLVTFDPSPAYYRESYGTYPVFRISAHSVGDRYWRTVAFEPQGDPSGAIIFTANLVAIVGDSGRWAVWADRDWDIAVVAAAGRDRPWRSTEVPFFGVEEALDEFVAPQRGQRLTPEHREVFKRSFG